MYFPLVTVCFSPLPDTNITYQPLSKEIQTICRRCNILHHSLWINALCISPRLLTCQCVNRLLVSVSHFESLRSVRLSHCFTLKYSLLNTFSFSCWDLVSRSPILLWSASRAFFSCWRAAPSDSISASTRARSTSTLNEDTPVSKPFVVIWVFSEQNWFYLSLSLLLWKPVFNMN